MNKIVKIITAKAGDKIKPIHVVLNKFAIIGRKNLMCQNRFDLKIIFCAPF